MAKTKVTLKWNGSLKTFADGTLVDANTAKTLGSTVISLMNEAIAKGLSPVADWGRFAKYAAQRNVTAKGKAGRSQRKRLYPFNIKPLNPVNLKVTGAFLETIKYQRSAKNGIELGHLKPDDKTEALFEAHNEGLNKYVPQRKYLPNKKGELFIVSIMRAIRNVYSQRIKSIINSNR